jgi:hypothetical protein
VFEAADRSHCAARAATTVARLLSSRPTHTACTYGRAVPSEGWEPRWPVPACLPISGQAEHGSAGGRTSNTPRSPEAR